MKDWLARKRQELSREHPPLSSYEVGDLVYITTGGTYQGRTAAVARFSNEKEVNLIDPFTLKPITKFLSPQCISPALEHEVGAVHEKKANEIYFVTQFVTLRRDEENRSFHGFCPVYKVVSASQETGGIKLENIETGEILTGEDGEPEYILKATELRPPNVDETRNAKTNAHARRQVQISGPDDAEIEGTVLDPDAATTAAKQGAANTDEPLNLRETLAELNEGHKLLAHRIGNLKVRTPFRQALAAEKAGKELAADQRSNVEFIHAMEDALKRARDAEKALRANKRVLASGLNSHDCDSI
ncbi:MAG: hypothetical protein JKY71_08685 [Alphaproteobacteria bacterium]|nr:hypothetical protein [Alphaproteobacteria bacterium]